MQSGTEPLSFEARDEFGRKVIAEKLVQLFKSEADVSPIVLNGAWGSGKTEFCLKLKNYILETQSDMKLVYVDSYKFDHSEDPLLMLISGIASIIPEKSQKNEYIKRAIPVIKVLGKVVAKSGLNWLVKTNIDSVSEEIADAASNEGEDLVDKGIEKALKNYEEIDQSISLFKAILQSLSEEHKIVIVIDELDRCTPTFALATLEKVKHVFDVKGVKFLFSTNLSQLSSVVRKQYGHSIDAEGYLNKFFKYTIILPEAIDNTYNEQRLNSVVHLCNLAKGRAELAKHINESNNIGRFLRHLFINDNISLRDAEKFFNNILVYNLFAGNRAISVNTIHGYTLIFLFGVYLYTFHEEVVPVILEDKVPASELEKILNVSRNQLISNAETRDIPLRVFAFFFMCDDSATSALGINEEVKKIRQTEVNQLFNGSFDAPDISSRLDLVKNAFKTLQLRS